MLDVGFSDLIMVGGGFCGCEVSRRSRFIDTVWTGRGIVEREPKVNLEAFKDSVLSSSRVRSTSR